MKIAIIDIDGLFYQSCRDTMEDSILVFKDKFKNTLEKIGTPYYIGVYSRGNYFRSEGKTSTYKANRKKQKKNKFLYALKQWAIAEYNLVYFPHAEADDVVKYAMFNSFSVSSEVDEEGFEKFYLDFECEPSDTTTTHELVLSSLDKDVLKSISGKHFNYTYKVPDKDKPSIVVKGTWIETPKLADPHEFIKSQMIIGDTADGIPGIKGKGEAYYKKMKERGTNTWEGILSEYISHFGVIDGIYEFQRSLRLLYILTTKEDFIREIGEYPARLEIQELVEEEEVSDELGTSPTVIIPKTDF